MRGTCQVCACTEGQPCVITGSDGAQAVCDWADDAEDLCTRCIYDLMARVTEPTTTVEAFLQIRAHRWMIAELVVAQGRLATMLAHLAVQLGELAERDQRGAIWTPE